MTINMIQSENDQTYANGPIAVTQSNIEPNRKKKKTIKLAQNHVIRVEWFDYSARIKW